MASGQSILERDRMCKHNNNNIDDEGHDGPTLSDNDNEKHQGNKLDSVLVEDEGWTGRKRYVELSPKISLPEFREVQQEHFTHPWIVLAKKF